jgi:hypothetical protein
MALISVFVPASLSVVEASFVTEKLDVPIIDLTQNYSQALASYGSNRNVENMYHEATPLLKRMVETSVSLSRPMALSPPDKCGLGCKYSFSYDAIAMKCRDIGPEEIWNDPTRAPPDSRVAFLQVGYQSSSQRGCLLNATVTSDVQSDTDPYRYTVAYIEYPTWEEHRTVDSNVLPYLKGVTCTFHNATYIASITFANYTQDLTIASTTLDDTPIPYKMRNCRYLPPGCVASPEGMRCSDNPNVADATYFSPNPCDFHNFHTKALISTFTDTMSGTIFWDISTLFDYNATYPLASIFSATKGAIYDSRGFGLSPMTESLGLGTALEQSFANMTLSLMSPSLNQTNFAEIKAGVLPFKTQYHYNPLPLSLLYGFNLLGVIISVIVSFIAVVKNGEATKDFSRFIAVTRDKSLNDIEAETELIYGVKNDENRRIFYQQELE